MPFQKSRKRGNNQDPSRSEYRETLKEHLERNKELQDAAAEAQTECRKQKALVTALTRKNSHQQEIHEKLFMNLQKAHQLAIAELDSTHSKAMETAVNAADAAAWKSSQTMMQVDYLATEKSLLDESAQQSEEVLCVCVSSNFLQFFLSSNFLQLSFTFFFVYRYVVSRFFSRLKRKSLNQAWLWSLH